MPRNGIATTTDQAADIERVVIENDLGKLSPDERLKYYMAVCQTLDLRWETRPFAYLALNGKLTLYATKDATDQLRTLRGISVTKLERERVDDLYVVTAYVATPDGRMDSSIGAVSIAGLKGEALANAFMKAETKSKRRATLSICGLGISDESEVGSIPDARVIDTDTVHAQAEALPATIDAETGEIVEPTPAKAAPSAREQPMVNRVKAKAAWDALAAKGADVGVDIGAFDDEWTDLEIKRYYVAEKDKVEAAGGVPA